MPICYECGREIKGRMTLTVPPNFAIELCGDFAREYHPRCYGRAEARTVSGRGGTPDHADDERRAAHGQ